MPGFNLTRPVAAYLREKLNLTPDEEEIALFGLQTILYPAVGLSLILFAGWLCGCLRTTLTVALTVLLLRLFSGGAHARSPLACALLGVIVVPALGKVAAVTAPLFTPFSLALTVAAGFLPVLVLTARLAPVDAPAKPVTAPEKRRRLRSLSLLVVLLVTAGQFILLFSGKALALVLAASLGLWWQTFTLTRAGHRFATILGDLKEGR
ncbi:accessory gene regulator B [Thermodesulfitimonas autotrophica]|uniref:Accessory gene regulator B n=1 Tax=Thermodesulfitimonas autotrophica TaxID=1894989 RepID=A0A3N5AXM3_9THEO|nr:accessory gene regulator B family protein [Thermodesulfitimonas autotrophica]RPF49653.1 accessory gene regulator B [Thermodesulfitimonas autotrophica]